MTGMESLLRSETPILLELDGEEYWIDKPTTRQAFAVLAVLRRMKQDEDTEGDRILLRRRCKEWLPGTPYAKFFEEPFPSTKRRRILRALVWGGIPEAVEERFKEAAGQDEGEGAPQGRQADDGYWWRQIARYQFRFEASFEEAMEVPWPVLLGQLIQLPMLRAQATKDVADANILVRSEDGQDAYEDLAEKARGGASEPEETPDTGAWSDDPEERKKWEARKMAELKEVKQNMKKRTPRDLNE